jgi:Transposase DDE domain group 1
LDAARDAHARARARFWELDGAPERLTLDVDGTLITAHSEKEKAAGNYKGGYGFHPLQVYLDETREALGGLLRPGNAGSNTADDHVAVLDRALAQIPAERVETLEILVRADSAGATHGLVDYCREANMRFTVGYELTEQVRAAILQIPADAWVAALDQDGSEHENGEVCEITDMVDLSAWPEHCRLIVRRERPHPGAQLSFTDHDGYRFQTILTDQPDPDIAVLECRHRQHAHVEDRIRDDKDTGPAKFPFKQFALNEMWLQIVMLAHDLTVWTQALILDGELATAEPKRIRHRLLHVAGRFAVAAFQTPAEERVPLRPSAHRRGWSCHGRPAEVLAGTSRDSSPHTFTDPPSIDGAAISPAVGTPPVSGQREPRRPRWLRVHAHTNAGLDPV